MIALSVQGVDGKEMDIVFRFYFKGKDDEKGLVMLKVEIASHLNDEEVAQALSEIAPLLRRTVGKYVIEVTEK